MTEHVKIDKPWGKGRIVWYRDATANDSDKSITVPAGKVWNLTMVRAHITTTATVGNRLLSFVITNGTNVVFGGPVTAAITASKTAILLAGFGSNLSSTVTYTAEDDGTQADVAVQGTLPEMWLPPGYVIRVWDTAAIDAAADDLIVTLHYIEYDN